MKKCPFCDGEIQDDAIKCKHCREWLEKKKEPVLKKDVSNDKTPTSLHWSFTQMKVIGYFMLFVIIILVLGIIGGNDKKNNALHEAKQEEANKTEEADKQITTVSAQELAFAYDQNTVAADQKFKGKRFKVTGTIVDINTDFLGNPYLVLSGGVNQFSNPQFEFDKKLANRLANVHKGEQVILECKGRGDIAKTPMSDSCIFSQ